MVSKLFAGAVLSLLATLLYFTLFTEGKIPALTVKTTAGETLILNDLKKPLIVNFWATTCPGCIAEMPKLAEIKAKFGDRFDIIAISMDYDPKEQVHKFIEKNPYPFQFVMDSDGALAKEFGDIKLTPTNFLIAPNGNIVYQKIGEPDFALLTQRIEQMSPQF